MVKTEGLPGADFENEWKSDSIWAERLFTELKHGKPKIIVAMSNKIYRLLLNDERFKEWRNNLYKIYHPSYVVRWNKHVHWNKQFKELTLLLKRK